MRTDPGPYTRRVTRPSACALIPVKAFAAAKGRLSTVLTPAERAGLARSMAQRVVAASAPLPVGVVCDDDDVAAWAASVGAKVVWTPGAALNAAVQQAVTVAATEGFARVVVAHADLPFAADLAAFADAEPDEALLVADRHGDGTNVLSVPTGTGFTFAYGPGSCRAHLAEAAARGLRARSVTSPALEWDVDLPDDLDPPAELGSVLTPTGGAP